VLKKGLLEGYDSMSIVIELKEATVLFKRQVIKKNRRLRNESFCALDSINLTVNSGEAIGIIGENGSGKTTLLSLIAGILKPDKGTVDVFGRALGVLGLGVGYKSELSARDNIYVIASMLGINEKIIKNRFDDIVDFAEIGDFVDTKLINFSSGMLMRLGFAIMINADPDVLLIDEVFSVGDARFRRRSLNKIMDFKKRGKTILVSSHRLGEVSRFCDKLLLLHQGCLVSEGDVSQIVSKYIQILNRESNVVESCLSERRDSIIRWGTREVEIVNVEIGPGKKDGRDGIFHGGTLKVTIHFNAEKRVEEPVFGIGIYDITGREIDGPNTSTGNYHIEYLEGEGSMEFHADDLPLYAGTYLLSVSVYDKYVCNPYDHHDRMYSFQVKGDSAWDKGIVKLKSSWSLERR